MRMSNFVVREAIIPALAATSREVVVVSDRQGLGWTDAGSFLQWQQVAREIAADRTLAESDPQTVVPSIRWKRFGDAQALAAAANYRLVPLHAPRTLTGVGHKLRISTALHGERLPQYLPPR